MSINNQPPIHIIGGPTASGKSAKALEIAAQTDGIILNADSVQIYDALPILTAQPPEEDKQQVPHEFYGVLDPNKPCSAGNWREMVVPRIETLLKNGQTPIIVGGSGLYIKALMEGLSPIPDIPDDIRQSVVEKYENLGAEAFYQELQKRDPVMAERFHVNHKARIIRAMEVLEATGQSLSKWQEEPLIGPPNDWEFKVHLILPERDILYQRCNERFEWMLDNGALDEVAEFANKIDLGGVKEGVPVTKALGFKPLRAYIKGALSREEAIMQAQADTRHYAKRQVTWFRHQIKNP